MSLNTSSISNRKFGIFFSFLFAAAFTWGLFKDYPSYLNLFLALVSAAFLVLAAIAPATLAWPNRLWFALGDLLGKITSPLILGIIFFGLITPVGIIGKWLSRDALALRKSTRVTYWKDRNTESRPASSFNNQF